MRKNLHYEIDQSIKVEQTERDTVIACTNDIKKTVLLPRKAKRDIQAIFKEEGKSRFFPYLVFSALVALILSEIQPKYKVIIDCEYTGYEDLILERIYTFMNVLGEKHVDLDFGHIGKTSQAHKAAASISLRKKRPTKVITINDVLELVFDTKKDRDP